MQIPPQISFHNIDKTDWAEEEIRARIDKLNTLYERLTTCRVHVDRRAASGSPASKPPPVVRIEMSVPGYRDLVVAYEPRRLQQRYQQPDLANAINDAFNAAERQLIDFKRQREGHSQGVQYQEAEKQFLGQVAETHPEQDHGFLMTKEGSLLYFHRNSVLSGDFDKLKRGDEVHYVETVGDTGPTASKVRPA